MLLMPWIQGQTLFFRLVISEVRLTTLTALAGRGRRAADQLAVGGWGPLLAHHLRQSVRGSHDNADGISGSFASLCIIGECGVKRGFLFRQRQHQFVPMANTRLDRFVFAIVPLDSEKAGNLSRTIPRPARDTGKGAVYSPSPANRQSLLSARSSVISRINS